MALKVVAKVLPQVIPPPQSPKVRQGKAQGRILLGGDMELDLPSIFGLGRFLELKVQIKAGFSLAIVEAIAPRLPLAVAFQIRSGALGGPLVAEAVIHQRRLQPVEQCLGQIRGGHDLGEQTARKMPQ